MKLKISEDDDFVKRITAKSCFADEEYKSEPIINLVLFAVCRPSTDMDLSLPSPSFQRSISQPAASTERQGDMTSIWGTVSTAGMHFEVLVEIRGKMFCHIYISSVIFQTIFILHKGWFSRESAIWLDSNRKSCLSMYVLSNSSPTQMSNYDC